MRIIDPVQRVRGVLTRVPSRFEARASRAGLLDYWRRRVHIRMKGFLERMQWKMAGAMQGRRGADSLSNTLVVAGIVCLVLSVLPHMGLFSWPALALLAYALFRTYSKNIAARDRENEAFLRATEKPRRAVLQVQGLRAGAFGPAWQGNASRGVPKVQDRNRKEVVAAHVRLHHGR